MPLGASAVVVFRNVVDGWSLGTVKAAVSLLDLNESAAPIVVVVAPAFHEVNGRRTFAKLLQDEEMKYRIQTWLLEGGADAVVWPNFG